MEQRNTLPPLGTVEEARSDAGLQRMQELFHASRSRWLLGVELLHILLNYETYGYVLQTKPVISPLGGSLYLMDQTQTVVRKDGINWLKKKNSSIAIREDYTKLRVNGVERLLGAYTKCADRPSFQRRLYFLVDDRKKPAVLVHYLDTQAKKSIVNPQPMHPSISPHSPVDSPSSCSTAYSSVPLLPPESSFGLAPVHSIASVTRKKNERVDRRILEIAPDWDFPHGGAKLLLACDPSVLASRPPPGYSHAVLFDDVQVPATLVLPNVLSCRAPPHSTGDGVPCSLGAQFEYQYRGSDDDRTLSTQERVYVKRLLLSLETLEKKLGSSHKAIPLRKQRATKVAIGYLSAVTPSTTRQFYQGMLLKLVCSILDGLPNHSWMNKTDEHGFAPLHYLAALGYEKLCCLMLACGADPELQTSLGENPLTLAERSGHSAVVDLLKQAVPVDGSDSPEPKALVESFANKLSLQSPSQDMNLVQSVVRIQAIYRGYRARKQFKQQKRAAARIQHAYRLYRRQNPPVAFFQSEQEEQEILERAMEQASSGSGSNIMDEVDGLAYDSDDRQRKIRRNASSSRHSDHEMSSMVQDLSSEGKEKDFMGVKLFDFEGNQTPEIENTHSSGDSTNEDSGVEMESAEAIAAAVDSAKLFVAAHANELAATKIQSAFRVYKRRKDAALTIQRHYRNRRQKRRLSTHRRRSRSSSRMVEPRKLINTKKVSHPLNSGNKVETRFDVASDLRPERSEGILFDTMLSPLVLSPDSLSHIQPLNSTEKGSNHLSSGESSSVSLGKENSKGLGYSSSDPLHALLDSPAINADFPDKEGNALDKNKSDSSSLPSSFSHQPRNRRIFDDGFSHSGSESGSIFMDH